MILGLEAPKSAASMPRALPFLSACLALLVSFAAAAAELTLVYDAHAGGFHVGTVTVRVARDGADYRMRSLIETTGLIGYVTEFRSRAETTGALVDGRPRPEAHRVDNVWRGRERRVRGTYPAAGPPRFAVEPEAAADDREPVPPALAAGSVDPLTAGLALALASEDGEGRVVPVFDGRRRYDVAVVRLAAAELSEPLYSGPATRVVVRLRPLAGGAKPRWYTPRPTTNTAELWFAPPRPETLGLPLPVRAEIGSSFGAAVVRLVDVRLTPSPEPCSFISTC